MDRMAGPRDGLTIGMLRMHSILLVLISVPVDVMLSFLHAFKRH